MVSPPLPFQIHAFYLLHPSSSLIGIVFLWLQHCTWHFLVFFPFSSVFFLLPTSLKADCQTFWCEDSYFELSFLLINFCRDRLEETKQGDLLVQVAERDWLAVPSLTPPPRPKHLREPTTRVYQIDKVLNRQSIK